MKRRSQLFLFDGILGFTLIIIALGVVFTYYSTSFESQNLHSLNQELLNSYTNTKINDLNDNEIRDFFRQGHIRNIHNSIAQQTSEFYYENKIGLAQNLTRVFVDDFVTKQINAKVLIFNQTSISTPVTLFEKLNRNVALENASAVSSTKRSVIGFINSTSSYGPYTIQILLWQ
ncbi:MAG: hypothetical protein HRU03_02280 [Nanoarchaeales archaeon]|nr:hypothetical protein [Nanoarchaeales archaeon]